LTIPSLLIYLANPDGSAVTFRRGSSISAHSFSSTTSILFEFLVLRFSTTYIHSPQTSAFFLLDIMGKLIKNHWARLIVLTAALYQVMAALEGFFWPKIFWDFLTKNLDGAVKPFPVLQIMNLVLGFIGLAWEWPLAPIVRMLPGLHRSMEARLVVYPLSALAAVLMYQSTNAALYYIVGVVVYFWAYSEGEVRQHSRPRMAVSC
jgi:hypothetical protein